MGSGGYATNKAKWERMERDLIAKGKVPETLDWLERTKEWYYGHGGGLDPETGKVDCGEKLNEEIARLKFIIDARERGLFRPNREKDELTYAIGTAEHGG